MDLYETNLNAIIYIFTEFLSNISLEEVTVVLPIIQGYLRETLGEDAVAVLNHQMKRMLCVKVKNRIN